MARGMMKKMLAAGLVGVLVLGMSTWTAAADEASDLAEEAENLDDEVAAEEDGTAGIYRLIGGKFNGEELNEEQVELMETMGMSARLTLRDDGTGEIDLFGEETSELNWDEKEISIEGEGAAYTLEDGKLTIEVAEDYLVFQKMTAEELSDGVGSGPLQPGDYDPDTHAGYYKLSTIEEDGEVTDAAVLSLVGMEVYLVLNEDNTGRLSLFDEAIDLTWDDEKVTAEDEEMEYAYDSGTITMESNGTTMNFVYAGTPDEAPSEAAAETAEDDAA